MNDLVLNKEFQVLLDAISILKELKFEKHQKAINRILSDKVEFKTIIDNNGGDLYCIAAKGNPNFYGSTAEDNAIKTIELIKDLIQSLTYSVLSEYNSFKINKGIPALKNMYIIQVEKSVYESLQILKDLYHFLESRKNRLVI